MQKEKFVVYQGGASQEDPVGMKDLALAGACVCSMGMLLGLALPARFRKFATFAAAAAFVGTYIPVFLSAYRHISKPKPVAADDSGLE